MKSGPEATDWSDYAFVALGSNLGASADSFSKVLPKLQEFADGPLLRSSWWKSSPVDCPPIRRVLKWDGGVQTTFVSERREFANGLQSLEREFGRVSKNNLK